MLSSTTSMQTVSCPPRWIAYPNMGGYGAHRAAGLTQAECLDACADDPRCVVVAWTRNDGCWIHHEHRQRYHRNDKIMTEYEIVRQCNFKSSVLIRIRDVITCFTDFYLFVQLLYTPWLIIKSRVSLFLVFFRLLHIHFESKTNNWTLSLSSPNIDRFS